VVYFVKTLMSETIIPGMRSSPHVKSNIATSDGQGLSNSLLKKLREHRWDRQPTE
jgi:aryl-alcohol dehydrogenase-like predicted oxidoreductase